MNKKNQLTELKIGDVTLPVLRSLNDLPFEKIIDFEERHLHIIDQSRGGETKHLLRSAVEYVTAYASAVGVTLDFEAMTDKRAAAKDCITGMFALMTHFSSANEDDDVDTGDSKNAETPAPLKKKSKQRD